jgi:hypothetical protein
MKMTHVSEPEWARVSVHSRVSVTKRAFRDDRGRWWIYRSDDPNMHTPMGPFFTERYAEEQAAYAQKCAAPFPRSLAHPQPAMRRVNA